MASIIPAENVVNPSNVKGSYLSASYAMQSGDIGVSPQGDTSTCAATSVQITGTFGIASVAIEGSNDGINWLPLHDMNGIMLAAQFPLIKSVQESTVYIRPNVQGGDNTTSLSVVFLFRRA